MRTFAAEHYDYWREYYANRAKFPVPPFLQPERNDNVNQLGPIANLLSKTAIDGLRNEIAAVQAGQKGPFPWLALLSALLPIILQYILPLLQPPTPVTGS